MIYRNLFRRRRNANVINKKFNSRIFTKQNKEQLIEVMVVDESDWLSQKLIAELFDTSRNNAHELDKESVCKDFLHTD